MTIIAYTQNIELTTDIIEKVEALPKGFGYNPNIYLGNIRYLNEMNVTLSEKLIALQECTESAVFDDLNVHVRITIRKEISTLEKQIQDNEKDMDKYFSWMMDYIDGTYQPTITKEVV